MLIRVTDYDNYTVYDLYVDTGCTYSPIVKFARIDGAYIHYPDGRVVKVRESVETLRRLTKQR